jgi:hypothetical protein
MLLCNATSDPTSQVYLTFKLLLVWKDLLR